MLETEQFDDSMPKKIVANTADAPLFKNTDSDVVYTHEHKVSCSGGEGVAGHPRVFLEISDKRGKVECPYCGKIFMTKKSGGKH